ncbi:transforming growth factor-beta-induced protein ig-h3 [Trichonephila clavipes]|nr:transforming growth factor-beta-induced protein ig-h3 [Trichonephila clavipes]
MTSLFVKKKDLGAFAANISIVKFVQYIREPNSFECLASVYEKLTRWFSYQAVTVNGHRIVHGDVTAPKGGLIHVIDGTLCPVADQDIINTLRTCNKYDGFLTLADVTKLLDTMQDDGPFTVFLPSNEALTKIPSDELAVLKENVTLLREFLEYHIVQGAYFSGDLKDGQYLTTIHQKTPIRVGVRVDGCYRRLVEANNSPLFKADIPTKNGVIHVIDWILRPSDLSWCEGEKTKRQSMEDPHKLILKTQKRKSNQLLRPKGFDPSEIYAKWCHKLRGLL